MNNSLDCKTEALVKDLTAETKKLHSQELGICVTEVLERNRIFARMTLDAVNYTKSQGKPVNLIDLGSGAGLNCLVAKLAGADRVLGIEHNENTCEVANSLMKKYNLTYELMQGDFLKADFGDSKFDVVINENLYPLLSEEPQLQAARKIRPNTHQGTIFVPDKIQFKFEYQGKAYPLEPIRFDGNYSDILERSTTLGEWKKSRTFFTLREGDREVFLKARLFDFQGQSVIPYSQGKSIDKIHLVYDTDFIINSGAEATLRWDTTRTQKYYQIFRGHMSIKKDSSQVDYFGFDLNRPVLLI